MTHLREPVRQVVREVRPEIQALRAAAVLLVVLYHFWPHAIRGGYAGVDVFFVISGYLISRHLMTEVDRTGRIDLGAFWARRIRRLLPASLLVVVVSAIGTLLFVPRTFWIQFARESFAAVGYGLNWLLARDSLDYLAAENNPSPVQHYWSLSVEEQFYLIWPLLILLAVLIARRFSTTRRVGIVLLSLLTAASLLVSIVLTHTSPASAYFVTPTRIWEFGAGALLALTAAASHPGRLIGPVVGWLGFAGILATGLLYTATTSFPGYTALLPVVSTAAVIWAGTTPQGWSSAQVSRLPPIQFLGNVSYSLYLWHWPLIVLAPFALARQPSNLDRVIMLIASVVLAWATKRYVEDPARTAKVLTLRRPLLTFAVTVVAMAVAVVLPAGGMYTAKHDIRDSNQIVAQRLKALPACFGAGALTSASCARVAIADVLPKLAAIPDDTGGAYTCYDQSPDAVLVTCSMGSTRPDALKVALQGDSHAAMLIPALRPYLVQLNWRVDTYVSRGCTWRSPTRTPGVDLPSTEAGQKGGQTDSDCAAYRTSLQNRLLNGPRYDLIIATGWRGIGTTAQEAANLATERAKVYEPVIARGTQVVVVEDNPTLPKDKVNCATEQLTRGNDGSACTLTRSTAFGSADSMPLVAAKVPGVRLVDLSDRYCNAEGCPMVIGGVVVYRDQHHLTATYIRTVAPTLVQRLTAALSTSASP